VNGPIDDFGNTDTDRALARRLSALAPEVTPADDALSALRPRMYRARTRARALKVGMVTVAAVAIGSAAAVAAPRSHSHVTVSGASPISSTTTHRTTTTTVRTTTTVAPRPTTKPVPVPPPVTSSASVPRSHGSGGAPVTTPATVPTSTGHGGSPTTVPHPSDLQTYSTPGGSITVRFSHDELSLVSVHAAPGFGHDVRDRGPDHVEVRFDHDGADYRIELMVEHGRVVRSDHGGY